MSLFFVARDLEVVGVTSLLSLSLLLLLALLSALDFEVVLILEVVVAFKLLAADLSFLPTICNGFRTAIGGSFPRDRDVADFADVFTPDDTLSFVVVVVLESVVVVELQGARLLLRKVLGQGVRISRGGEASLVTDRVTGRVTPPSAIPVLLLRLHT